MKCGNFGDLHCSVHSKNIEVARSTDPGISKILSFEGTLSDPFSLLMANHDSYKNYTK